MQGLRAQDDSFWPWAGMYTPVDLDSPRATLHVIGSVSFIWNCVLSSSVSEMRELIWTFQILRSMSSQQQLTYQPQRQPLQSVRQHPMVMLLE